MYGLVLKNICKSFNSTVAVSNLSLSVPSGKIYGLLGPNGAGKTTTIRMVMNIIRPDSGEIEVLGEPAGESTKDRIGFLPEERGLYQSMSVRDVLLFLAEIKNLKRSDTGPLIVEWLERMGLSETIDKKVQTLSKGMQQKLQFISVLIHEPDLIILDEPFSGLDPVNVELIKDIIMEEKRKGRTIIFSTHVMEQAEKLCDHITLINKGEKVLDGPLFEIKAKFGRNSVIAEIDGDAREFETLDDVERISDFNKYVEFKLTRGGDSQRLLHALAEKTTVNRFEVVEPSLHDIFIDVVRGGDKRGVEDA